MAEQFYTILTEVGKAKIANANVIGNKINFAKLKVGDGGGTFYNPTETQTDIKNKVWEGNINSIYVDEKNLNWIVIETIIPGDVGGFTIRETGIFDDENNLIAVSNYPETYKPIASEGSSKDVVIKIILEVSNSNTITFKIDPTVMIASKADIKILQSSMTEISSKVNLHITDNMRHNSYVVATNVGNKYSVTVSNLAVLSDGYPLAVKFNEASTGAITLNPNNLGDIRVVDYFGNQVTNVRKNLIANLRYESVSNSFILLGRGGEGDLVEADLLYGKKATGNNGPVVGKMPNNAAVVITPGTTNKPISLGYHNGNGYVLGDAELIPANIVKDIDIFGVKGTATIESLGGRRFKKGSYITTSVSDKRTIALDFIPHITMAYSDSDIGMIIWGIGLWEGTNEGIVNRLYSSISSSYFTYGSSEVFDVYAGVIAYPNGNSVVVIPPESTPRLVSWIAIE